MPKKATLSLYICTKFSELVLLAMFTGLLTASGAWLIDAITEQSEITSEDYQCIAGVFICVILALYNLFYNNLLINLRFFGKMRCVTFGLCFFDCFNYACCYCFLRKLCVDRIVTEKLLFFIKWGLTIAIMVYTSIQVENKRERWEQEFETPLVEIGKTRFDTYLIIYMLQLVIFYLVRIPLFCIVSLVTCCSDAWDEEMTEADYHYQSRIFSFKFVEYELDRLHNFQHHPIGRGELAYNRNLEFVRQESHRQRQDHQNQQQANQKLGRSFSMRVNQNLAATQFFHFNLENHSECAFCYMTMGPGDKLVQLHCFDTHQFHKECFDTFVEHSEKANTPLLCPHCRQPIDKNNVKKREILPPQQNAHLQVADAFGLPSPMKPLAVGDTQEAGDFERETGQGQTMGQAQPASGSAAMAQQAYQMHPQQQPYGMYGQQLPGQMAYQQPMQAYNPQYMGPGQQPLMAPQMMPAGQMQPMAGANPQMLYPPMMQPQPGMVPHQQPMMMAGNPQTMQTQDAMMPQHQPMMMMQQPAMAGESVAAQDSNRPQTQIQPPNGQSSERATQMNNTGNTLEPNDENVLSDRQQSEGHDAGFAVLPPISDSNRQPQFEKTYHVDE